MNYVLRPAARAERERLREMREGAESDPLKAVHDREGGGPMRAFEGMRP